MEYLMTVGTPVSITANFTDKFQFRFAAAIMAVANGVLIVWLTPILPLLKSDETPLESGPLSLQEVSWLGSIVPVGAMIGSFVGRPLTNRVGCKRMMELLPIPTIVSVKNNRVR